MPTNWGMIEQAQRELRQVTREKREAAHYRAAKSMDRILKRLEKDGATNEDEKYDLAAVRKALDTLLESVTPFNIKLKRKRC